MNNELEGLNFEEHPQTTEAEIVLEPPVESTPSKKQKLMNELKEYGISRSEWKSFLKKENMQKSSIGLQLAYVGRLAEQIAESRPQKQERHFDLVVSTKKDPLKRLRDELLLELGISTRKFKSMIPKVINKSNGTWDVATKQDLAKRRGAKMSIRQQVVWLQELIDATKEIRESVKQGAKADQEMEKIEVSGPTFATEENES